MDRPLALGCWAISSYKKKTHTNGTETANENGAATRRYATTDRRNIIPSRPRYNIIIINIIYTTASDNYIVVRYT